MHRTPRRPPVIGQEDRKSIRKIWKDTTAQQRASWEDLFKARSFVTDTSAKGQGLLLSQGLLVNFVPDYQPLHSGPRAIPRTEASGFASANQVSAIVP